MKYRNLIKNNSKFIIVMIFVIVLGIIGVTLAINISSFNPISINTKNAELGVNLTYLDGSSANITSSGKLVPINDVTNPITSTVTSADVLKISFSVSGVSTNPSNSIYDISLHDINMACELKNNYFKWKLFKNGTSISSGSFSNTFDTNINNSGRMVLTDTQQDLTTNTDNYVLVLWLQDSCTGDISTCNSDATNRDQSDLLNKSFSAKLKIELSTGRKKEVTRTTGDEITCTKIVVSEPSCDAYIYNGAEQNLISTTNEGYTLINNKGIRAGNYVVTVKLNPGYGWDDGKTADKIKTCQIQKKNVIITANDQRLSLGKDIVSSVSNITVSGLIEGHSVSQINLYAESTSDISPITASAAKIVDGLGNDVTENYNINYVSGYVRKLK